MNMVRPGESFLCLGAKTECCQGLSISAMKQVWGCVDGFGGVDVSMCECQGFSTGVAWVMVSGASVPIAIAACSRSASSSIFLNHNVAKPFQKKPCPNNRLIFLTKMTIPRNIRSAPG